MKTFLHGVRTTNEASWVVPWLPIKSKMAVKMLKMLIIPYWINICTKCYGKMHHGHAEMTTWVTKSRNRKLIRVTSSNERPEHKCVDLSDYNRYLTPIVRTTLSQDVRLSVRYTHVLYRNDKTYHHTLYVHHLHDIDQHSSFSMPNVMAIFGRCLSPVMALNAVG